MNSTVIHDRKVSPRDYYGMVDAEPLLRWLNDVSARKDDFARMAWTRVMAVVELIAGIEKVVGASKPEGGWQRKPKAIRDAETALNMRLADYEFIYAVDPSASSPLAWTLRSTEDPALSASIPGETLAVYHLVELGKLGLVEKIRQCDCGLYFFARLPKQRFHGDECRIRFWEESPERKARRREKAREYYNLHKSGKVR